VIAIHMRIAESVHEFSGFQATYSCGHTREQGVTCNVERHTGAETRNTHTESECARRLDVREREKSSQAREKRVKGTSHWRRNSNSMRTPNPYHRIADTSGRKALRWQRRTDRTCDRVAKPRSIPDRETRRREAETRRETKNDNVRMPSNREPTNRCCSWLVVANSSLSKNKQTVTHSLTLTQTYKTHHHTEISRIPRAQHDTAIGRIAFDLLNAVCKLIHSLA
jgi:hypothetical protein